ncbi:MAG: caspase family protein [Saprospiraceae bacterium]
MKVKLTIFFFFVLMFGYAQVPNLVIPIGHTGGVTSLAVSTKNAYILSGSRDNTAKIWDAGTHEIQKFTLTEQVQAVTFSPGGDSVLLGSTDAKLSILKLTGELIAKIGGHSKSINAVSFSPDGKRILSGSDDFTAILQDVNGSNKKIFRHQGVVTSVVFSKDGKSIVTGSTDKTAVIRNLKSGSIQTLAHPEAVMQLCMSRNGKFIVTTTNGKIPTARLWSSAGVKLQQITHLDKILACDFSPDSNLIATASFDGKVKIWNTNGLVLTEFKAYNWGLSAVRFSADGKSIYTSTEVEMEPIIQWDLKGKPMKYFKGHAQVVTSVCSSPDNQIIVTGCADNSLKVWDVFHNTFNSYKKHEASINAVAYAPNNNFILTGSDDKTVKLWDVKGNVIFTRKLQDRVTSVAFSKDGNSFLASCYSGCTMLWKTNGDTISKLNQIEKVYTAAFSPNGEFIATGSYEGVIRLFDLLGNPLNVINTESQINSLVFSTDSKSVITANYNGLTQYWNISTGENTGKLGRPMEELFSLTISKDGKFLATGADNGVLTLWDPESQNSKNLVGHTSKVTSLNFMSNNTILISGSADGTVKLWDCNSGQEIVTMVSLDSIDWAVKNPKGLFDASANSLDKSSYYYIVDLEVVDLDQLKEKYYQPGLLAGSLGILNIEFRDVSNFGSIELVPKIEANFQNDTDIEVNIEVRKGGMGKLGLFINDREVNENVNPENKTKLIINLNPYQKYLAVDSNQISLRVYSANGWLKSQSIDLPLYPLKGSKGGSGNDMNQEPVKTFKGIPSLFALFVGTSNYAGTAIDLVFPDKDATYMAKGISEIGKRLFKKPLYIKLLTTAARNPDSIANKKNIEKILKEYAAIAKEGDVLMLYFSGHGATYRIGDKAPFYYLTQDISTEADLGNQSLREKFALSSEELQNLIKPIAARKQVLIFDACHSGNASESFDGVAARDLSPSAIIALDRLKDKMGMFILSGSAADKVSFEASEYGQGLLTYSLLQGIKGFAVEVNKNVDVQNLFSHAVKTVPELAKNINKIQVPVLAIPKSGTSFPIGVMDTILQIPDVKSKPVFIRHMLSEEIVSGDSLGVNDALSEYFRGIMAEGPEAELVYWDLISYPNAYMLDGFYKIEGTTIKLQANLKRGKKLVTKLPLISGSTSDLKKLSSDVFDEVLLLLPKN